MFVSQTSSIVLLVIGGFGSIWQAPFLYHITYVMGALISSNLIEKIKRDRSNIDTFKSIRQNFAYKPMQVTKMFLYSYWLNTVYD